MRCGIYAFHLLGVACESLNFEAELGNGEGWEAVEAFCSVFEANCVRFEGVARSRTAKTHYRHQSAQNNAANLPN